MNNTNRKPCTRGKAINWDERLAPYPGKDNRKKLENLFKKYVYMYAVQEVLGIADSVTLRRYMQKIGMETQKQTRYDWMFLLRDYRGVDVSARLRTLNSTHRTLTGAANAIGVGIDTLRGKYIRAGINYSTRGYHKTHDTNQSGSRGTQHRGNPAADIKKLLAEIRRRNNLPDDYDFFTDAGQAILQRHYNNAERVRQEGGRSTGVYNSDAFEYFD